MTRRSQILAGTALLAIAGGVAMLIIYTGGVFDAPRALTRSEYLSRIDMICRAGDAKLRLIPPPAAAGNPEALALSIGGALPLLERRLSEERAVRPPRSLAKPLRRAFALADESIRALRTTRARARARDKSGAARAFVQFLEAQNRARAAANAIGITC